MNERDLIDYASGRLRQWAYTRDQALEGLGHSGISVTEAMRERAWGGAASTAPAQLTRAERQVGRDQEVLEVEQAVRALPSPKRTIVESVYLREATHAEIAKVLGVTRQAVGKHLDRILVSIACDLHFSEKLNRNRRQAQRDRKEASARNGLFDRLRAGDVA